MPFVTEEVWQHLYRSSNENPASWPASALIIAPWPQYNATLLNGEAEWQFSLLQEVITRIRDARNQMNVEPSRRIPVLLAVGEHQSMFAQQAPLIEFLARTEKPQLHTELTAKPEQAMSLLADRIEIYLPLAGMLDIAKELERIDKEIAQAEQERDRLQRKLANQNFVARAKSEIVEQERVKLATQQDRLGKLTARRAELAAM
jgi:valyl-tRNA synthetase